MLLRRSKPFFERLKNNWFFARMIFNTITIIRGESRNIIPPISFWGHRLKKFWLLVAKFDPSNSTSLPPILFLIIKKPQNMVFEYASKILFWSGETPFIFKFIKFKEIPVGVFNGNRQFRNTFTPNFQITPQVFKLAGDNSGHVGRGNWFGPRIRNHVQKARMMYPIRFEPEKLWARNVCLNANHTRDMIGNWPAKRFY